MDALTNSFCSVLLMGLITRVALLDWIRRRGRGVRSLWWLPAARAFTAAGVFLVLALSYWEILSSPPGRALWHWIPDLPIGEPGDMTSAVLFGFPFGFAGALTMLLETWRPSRGSQTDGRKPSSGLAKAALLVAPAVA